MHHCLYTKIYQALTETDPANKSALAKSLYQQWQAGELLRDIAAQPLPHPVRVPGRPDKPMLVSPFEVPRKSLRTTEGRAALIHAITHIEFNAINLALDAAWRFRAMPDAFVDDWLRIAAEEALHFDLLRARLQALGYDYGDFCAHNSLWDMAVETDHDVMVRMALVPRVLEARGLDATPGVQLKLAAVGDHETVAALDIILRDEIGHVRIGNDWFIRLCDERGISPLDTFRQLLLDYQVDRLRGAYNLDARREAGFSETELMMLQDFAATRQHPAAGA